MKDRGCGAAPAFLAGGGEVGALMRAKDWSGTPLGPSEAWSPVLRSLVALVLGAKQPMFLAWGPELCFLYNDAYTPIFGAKHPSGLGRPFAEVWSDIWEQVGPIVEATLSGEAQVFEDLPIPMMRHGYPETPFFSFSYTQLRDETDAVAGLFCAATETTAKVLAEREVQAEKTRLRALFEQAPGFMCVLRSPEHVFELLNGAYLQLVGHRDLIGRPIREALPEIEGQGFFEQLNHVYATGEPLVGRQMRAELQRQPDADLAVRYVDFVFQPIRDAAGDVTGIFVEGNDVTESHEAHEALRVERDVSQAARDQAEVAAAERAAILTQLAEGVIVTDSAGAITFVNEAAVRIHGLVGLNVLPKDYASTYNLFNEAGGSYPSAELPLARAVLRDETVTDAKWAIVRPDGSRVIAVGSARPVRALDGTKLGAVLTLRDDTARLTAEASLREFNATLEARVAAAMAERNLLATIIETTDAFIQVLDLDYRILAINKAGADEFERIYGVRPRIGDLYPELLADQPDELAAVQGFWGRALAGEEFTFTEAFGDSARDRPYYEIKFNTLRNAQGERIGAYQFVYDVTERLRKEAELRETQEQLRQSQKMEAMGQLTGGVAHDFNNLLTPIIGSLDRLATRGVGSEREQRLIAGALESAERAKTLVQRLLAFARRQPLQAAAVDLHRLVEGIAKLLRSTLGPKIAVHVELADDLPPVHADGNQLEMAILNLAVNARDAMPEGGRLTIRAAREGVRGRHRAGLKVGHYVRLSVVDTGTGMDKATLARAVEPFFSTKGIGKGTGLGLSMVHGLASQLGGGLSIESRLGQGTTVELWLPLSTRPIDEAEIGQAGPHFLESQGRALLVDDEELVRMSTAEMLIEMGYDVVEASSAEDALRLLQADGPIDLLVTDHLMPGMSGADLAHKIKRLRPTLPILIVSGYADVDSIASDLPRMAKPFRAAELAERVTAIVANVALAK